MGTASKDKRDIYYRKAKEEGWRARSAFKLLQIEDSNQIFNGVRRVVDLCAAPGSWSQVLSRRLYLPAKRAGSTDLPTIVAVDLQPMAPIEGITTIQGDITSEGTISQILQHFEDEKADLVISDGAPDVTGMHDMDQYVQGQLIVAALTIVGRVLREGGTFVAKIFRGKDISLLYSQLKILFPEVSVVKPWSSRNSSIEAFVLCRNYTPPADFEAAAPALLHMLSFKSNNMTENNVLEASLGTGADTTKICGGVLPFLACGSLQWDSDMTYDLEEVEEGSDKATERLQPVQPPLAPHYKEAMEKINRWRF